MSVFANEEKFSLIVLVKEQHLLLIAFKFLHDDAD
jgi:hypothetical protein